MNYKEEIKKIIDQINSQTILRLIYHFAISGLKEEKEKES